MFRRRHFAIKYTQTHPDNKEALYEPNSDDIVLHKNKVWLCAKPFYNKHWLICFTEEPRYTNIKDLLILIRKLYEEYNIDTIIVESRHNLWTRLLARFETKYQDISNRDFYTISIKNNFNKLQELTNSPQHSP